MVAWRRPAFSHCTVSYFTLKWSYSFSLYSSIFFSYSLTTMRKWKTWKWVFKRAQKRIHQQNASQLHLLNEFFSYLTNTIIVKSRLFLFLLSSHSSVLALVAKSVSLQLHTILVRALKEVYPRQWSSKWVERCSEWSRQVESTHTNCG